MSLYRSIDFALWSRIHRLPPLFVKAHQLRELKRTVTVAYKRSPFYQKLFWERGFLPEDMKTLGDIRRLPIINKQMLRQFPVEAAMDASFPAQTFVWKQTSGSTGEPFIFPSCASPSLFNRFGFVYTRNYGLHLTLFLRWKGISSKYARKRMSVAEIRVHNQPRFLRFLHVPVSDLRECSESVVHRLREFAPYIVNSRATVLVELARICSKFPRDERPKISYMTSHGENFTKTQRGYIKDILGTEPYNRYGLEEVGSIAIDCEKHDGLHIHEESYIIEILDEKDNPLPDGKSGRIVLTFFYNDILPLIRYDTGDQGFIISKVCECGVRARRIFVDGRRGGFLNIGSRKFNNVEFEVFLTEASENILRWQVAKADDAKIEIRIIPASGFSSSEANELGDKFYQYFRFRPSIKIVDDIAYAADGKAHQVVDESRPGTS